ncbi:hypothetical protein V6N12_032765 [Hibiscus sabdariffa]|uniref:Uncharacterized protein n=1 Tax=Hibiscus sabdariffa TaxID=183260 RepID=A0ABR2ADY0_9ROSI
MGVFPGGAETGNKGGFAETATGIGEEVSEFSECSGDGKLTRFSECGLGELGTLVEASEPESRHKKSES